jgi:hypothetical protein
MKNKLCNLHLAIQLENQRDARLPKYNGGQAENTKSRDAHLPSFGG